MAVGSFAEVVFAVAFRDSTPDEVVAAFATALTGEHPGIDAEVPAGYWDWDLWEPGDDDPWVHPWGDVLGMDMSNVAYPGQTGATLRWYSLKQEWQLTARAVWKCPTAHAARLIGWIAPFTCPRARPDRRQFVGYIVHEYDPGPTLIWHDGARFEFDGIEHAGET